MNNAKSSLRNLEKILQNQPNPECINGGSSSAPSKRIKDLYPDYQKSVDAVRILQRTRLVKIREKCKHFHDWVAKLEALSKK